MNIAKFLAFDTVNGPGIRASVFVSGCTLRCKGCFNTESQNFKYGDNYCTYKDKIIKTLDNPFIEGLSLLGGDPCELKNINTIIELCTEVKKLYPTKSIWMWTGRTIEELKSNPIYTELYSLVDVIVDGRFIEELKDLNLQYRGSSNQRVLYKGKDY